MYIPNTKTDEAYNRKNIKDEFSRGMVRGMEYVADDIIDRFVSIKEFDMEIDEDDEDNFVTVEEAKSKIAFMKLIMKSFKEWLEGDIDEVAVNMLDDEYIEAENAKWRKTHPLGAICIEKCTKKMEYSTSHCRENCDIYQEKKTCKGCQYNGEEHGEK